MSAWGWVGCDCTYAHKKVITLLKIFNKFKFLCAQVFKPPNPWTMSIMNVLCELHQEPDLKLNLKFEIEVLCKNLSLDVSVSNPN